MPKDEPRGSRYIRSQSRGRALSTKESQLLAWYTVSCCRVRPAEPISNCLSSGHDRTRPLTTQSDRESTYRNGQSPPIRECAVGAREQTLLQMHLLPPADC